MGILQRIGLLPSVTVMPEPIDLVGPIFDAIKLSTKTMDVATLWEDQPHLRTVTTFIARSIASLQLHAYERKEDGGRERIRGGEVSQITRLVAPDMLTYDLMERTILDMCLYDEFFWLIVGKTEWGFELRPIPISWIRKRNWVDQWTLESIVIDYQGLGETVEIPADRLIHRRGYNPNSVRRGKSPIQALRDTLSEQIESGLYRAQKWRNGPKVGSVITRGPEKQVGSWAPETRRRFMANLRAAFSANSSDVGGTLILEDGMDIKNFDATSKDEQVVEMTKLSLQTVAQVYQINPTMVGQLDNANYSNVKEFRKSLYGDNLASWIRIMEDVLNLFLLPKMGVDNETVYLEFNIEEKLRSSFEEKAAVMQTAVGVPWMLVEEARAMENLPNIEGGDKLAKPLNMGYWGDSEEDPEPAEEPAEEPGGGGDDT